MTRRHSEGYIQDLCIALAHRYEPGRLFMIFTSYFDEADTHKEATAIIMGGFLGHAYEWRRFEKKLGRIQKRDGFEIFHAKEFNARSGEFKGWSDEKRWRLICDLTDLVEDNLTDGCVVALENDKYQKEYRSTPFPAKMPVDSQYGICFRSCLTHLLDVMAKRGYRDTLHVVLERGHKNAGDCERIFNDMKARYKKYGCNVFGDFTLALKDDCYPLMVGDMIAAHYSTLRSQHPEGIKAYSESVTIPEPPKGKAGLTYLELMPDALHTLKTGWEKFKQLEIDEWRAQREAKRNAAQTSQKQAS